MHELYLQELLFKPQALLFFSLTRILIDREKEYINCFFINGYRSMRIFHVSCLMLASVSLASAGEKPMQNSSIDIIENFHIAQRAIIEIVWSNPAQFRQAKTSIISFFPIKGAENETKETRSETNGPKATPESFIGCSYIDYLPTDSNALKKEQMHDNFKRAEGFEVPIQE